MPRFLVWQEYWQAESEVEEECQVPVGLQSEWYGFTPPKADFEFQFDVNGVRSKQVLNGLQVAQKATSRSRAILMVDAVGLSGTQSVEVYLLPPTIDGNVLKLTIDNVQVVYPRYSSDSVIAMRK